MNLVPPIYLIEQGPLRDQVELMVGTRITRENLPAKFHPYLSLTERGESRPDNWNPIAAVAQEVLTANVAGQGNYVIKSARRGPEPGGHRVPSTEDTHLYRVRKADKIRNFIVQRGYEGDVVVAGKTLYWDEAAQEMVVVAERLPLSNEVAEFADAQLRVAFMLPQTGGDERVGQTAALMSGAMARAFTPRQARALAEMAFECGYTDMRYNNIFFHEDGRVAIIDTEPVKRRLKKDQDGFMSWFFLDRRTFSTFMDSLAGAERLKMFTSNPEARREIEQVEKDHFLYPAAIIAGKLALSALVYFAFAFLAYGLAVVTLSGGVIAMGAGVALTGVALAVTLAAMFKTVAYATQFIIASYGSWLSQRGDPEKQILRAEVALNF